MAVQLHREIVVAELRRGAGLDAFDNRDEPAEEVAGGHQIRQEIDPARAGAFEDILLEFRVGHEWLTAGV